MKTSESFLQKNKSVIKKSIIQLLLILIIINLVSFLMGGWEMWRMGYDLESLKFSKGQFSINDKTFGINIFSNLLSILLGGVALIYYNLKSKG